MSRAEDAVRARIAARNAGDGRAEVGVLDTGIAPLAAKIQDAIPRILAGLAARDFPHGRLLSVGSVSRGVFRKRHGSVEMAAWVIYESDRGEFRGFYLVADGCIHTCWTGGQGSGLSRGPHTVPQILAEFGSPERVLLALQLIWNGGSSGGRGPTGARLPPTGIKALLKQYGSPET